jgi:hypothetical protein
VFVTAVTQLGLALARDVSPGGYLHFGLLFVPVWWAWVGYTNYADRFDSDDLLFRLLMLGGMFGITIVAVAIPDTFRHGSAVFAGAYAAVRLLLIVLYARARRHVPEARVVCGDDQRVHRRDGVVDRVAGRLGTVAIRGLGSGADDRGVDSVDRASSDGERSLPRIASAGALRAVHADRAG